MTTIPRPDLEPMPGEISAWARGDDLVPVPQTRPRPGVTVAVLVLGVGIGLSLAIVAVLGRIVTAVMM